MKNVTLEGQLIFKAPYNDTLSKCHVILTDPKGLGNDNIDIQLFVPHDTFGKIPKLPINVKFELSEGKRISNPMPKEDNK